MSSASVRAFLFSFQTKLILSLSAVIILAIFLAGVVFVLRTRDERREQALARVASASPAIYQQAFVALIPAANEKPFSDELRTLAEEQDVRILILTRDSVVLYDTGDGLTGAELAIPQSGVEDLRRGFISWEPDDEFPEHDLTFVSASSRFVTERGAPLPFRIVLAVESDTIASAWLGLLPALTLAALVAVPISSLFAVLLARQVARPVQRLTAASEALAKGDFSQRVEAERDDELGRLARSFTSMAERVGSRDAQMRALLANVSHDLKTPMTSITGYAQSLTDGTARPEDAARIGKVILEEAEHVNSLLADLLYLGEIDAGQVLTRHEDLPLAALVSRCLRHIEPAAQAKRLDVTVEVAPDALLHGVDGEKLERALTNVLDNAVKFAPPGGSIAVRGWRQADEPRVSCSVTNSGAPIPEEDLPRLFDRFFRGDRARAASEGSGLGLSIARELVALNGGRIEARNGQGSVTMLMSFPA